MKVESSNIFDNIFANKKIVYIHNVDEQIVYIYN